MTTSQSSSLELLSALADGELSGGELSEAELISGEPVFKSNNLHSEWDSYQVIGHALRGGASASGLMGADSAFLQRLNLRLKGENVGLPALPALPVIKDVTALLSQPAANDAAFRWKLLAGFASASAALVVAWSVVGTPDTSTASQISQSSAPEQRVVSSPQGPIVRDARLEELMAAHKQLGGSSLQAPSGFLRNAGFENSQSGQR
jgi:sigma-E factor negative regulatory protein RseA